MTNAKPMTNQYDRYGRLRYTPDIHDRHKQSWTTTEEKYLIENYENDGPETVSLALGRTIGVAMTRAYVLRKAGKMKPRSPNAHNHKRMRAAIAKATGGPNG